MNEKEFKEYLDTTVNSIFSKIDDDEKEFLDLLIKTFNRKCETIENCIEFIKKNKQKNEFDLLTILNGVCDYD